MSCFVSPSMSAIAIPCGLVPTGWLVTEPSPVAPSPVPPSSPSGPTCGPKPSRPQADSATSTMAHLITLHDTPPRRGAIPESAPGALRVRLANQPPHHEAGRERDCHADPEQAISIRPTDSGPVRRPEPRWPIAQHFVRIGRLRKRGRCRRKQERDREDEPAHNL